MEEWSERCTRTHKKQSPLKGTFGHSLPGEPISLTVAGINSAAEVSAHTGTSFTLKSGDKTVAHEMSAVVVPEWDAEVLLEWNNLRNWA